MNETPTGTSNIDQALIHVARVMVPKIAAKRKIQHVYLPGKWIHQKSRNFLGKVVGKEPGLNWKGKWSRDVENNRIKEALWAKSQISETENPAPLHQTWKDYRTRKGGWRKGCWLALADG